MGFRDRFFTPQTAKAILSWRILVGVAVGVGLGVLAGPLIGVAGGLVAYAGFVLLAMPKPPATVRIDAFTLSEPWRHFVQQGERAGRRLGETIAGATDGPLKQRLIEVAGELERALRDAYRIAQRGDQIDATVSRLDPVRLRSRMTTLDQQAGADPTAAQQAAIDSVREQLASADRLKAQSRQTADQLRLTQIRLDELVARAAEVAVGTAEPDTYARDVDNLVEQLDALYQATLVIEGTGSVEPSGQIDTPGPQPDT